MESCGMPVSKIRLIYGPNALTEAFDCILEYNVREVFVLLAK
jgi:hypothetical protein